MERIAVFGSAAKVALRIALPWLDIVPGRLRNLADSTRTAWQWGSAS